MTIRAVLWDLGGVLLRTEDQSSRIQLEDRLGLPRGELGRIVFDSEASLRATVGEMTTEDVWTWVLERLGLPQIERDPFVRDFFTEDRIDQVLMDYIRSLRPARKTGMITNAWDIARHYLETRWHIADAFDVLVISAEERLAKPDARIYELALSRLGVQPQESVFVDDLEANVAGAKAIGMHAIRFQSTPQILADLRGLLEESA
jgi:epoxide hydrolase-like predicted phosphatase